MNYYCRYKKIDFMFVSEIKIFDRDVSTNFAIKDAKHVIHRRDKHEGRKS